MITTLSEDRPERYAAEIEAMTEIRLPSLPEKVGWDLSELWDSEFLLGEPQ